MLRLNRNSEYGLIALRYMSQKLDPLATTTARELSDHFVLPFDITAKTLQKLKEGGLISSLQGVKGGYQLKKQLSEVSMADFLNLMEGHQALVSCLGDSQKLGCDYSERCEIRNFVAGVNFELLALLKKMSLSRLMSRPIETQATERLYN